MDDVSSKDGLPGATPPVAPGSDFGEDPSTLPRSDDGELWHGKADGVMPTRGIVFGPRVPDLTRIAEDRWPEVRRGAT